MGSLSMFSILHFIIIFLFIFYSSVLRSCNGADIISPGQSISGDQNITSAGDIFVLGFFSPGNSQNRYIGIWYLKVSVQTVVWVANRETPVTDASGILRIGNDGNLMIQDGTGRTLWSTNTAVAGSKAVLLDTGNLIISSSTDGEIVWQSFDYPSNTFLPGMKLGLNLNTGQNWLLTSWRNAEDPASGSFVLGMDPDRSSQFFIWKKGVRYWASGAWNGQTFTGIPEMRRNYIFNFSYINDDNNQIFTYSMYNTSIISRSIIDLDGRVKQLTWLESSQQWVIFWSQPRGTCDIYSLCGAFGTCKEYPLPECSCLPGFEPQSPKDWNSSDWSEGCTRSSGLKCGNVDVFSPLNRMKLPVGARSLVVSSRQDCEAECQRNCSCTAYALVNGTRCLVWGGALVDLQQFTSTGEDLYIRLAAHVFQDAKITGSKLPNKVILVIIIVTTSLGMILLVTCIIFSWRRRQKERGMRETSQELSSFDLSSPVEIENNFTHANNLVEDTKNSPDLPIFNFGSVVAATDNFSITNKLGEGGFGPVYKGKLLGGQEVAVKRLSMSSGQGLEEFKNEVVLIAKLQHRNLVRVLGCCIQGREKILIYEYMPNRSLDFFLFDPTKRAILDWEKRFRIIEGITQGLLYLHQHSRLRIIHRDLKASNILLDGEMNPRISDFGMARMFGENQAQANTRRVVGTYGYMAPEYALEGRFSVKSDVFSFGVMILEIVSGKRNTGIYQFKQSLNLLGYAWELWKEGRGLELLDPSLGDLCPRGEVLKCIHVGLLCVQEDAGDRPTMSSVILMLASESMTLPAPKKPAFSIGSSSSSRPLTCSANDVTITTADGR